MRKKGMVRYGLFAVCAAVFIYATTTLVIDRAETQEVEASFAVLAKSVAQTEDRQAGEGTGRLRTEPGAIDAQSGWTAGDTAPARETGETAGEGLLYLQPDSGMLTGMGGAFPGEGEQDTAAANRAGATPPAGAKPAADATPAPSAGTASPTGQVHTPSIALRATPSPTPVEMKILEKYKPLLVKNSDFGGWVKIPGTSIDYPIMYTPEKPEKYLKRNFEGRYSAHGVPFIGRGCTINPRSENLIVYGHHMRDGTMFAQMTEYQHQSFWEENPTLWLATIYEEADYEVFAVFLTDIYNARSLRCYNYPNFEDKTDYDAFISDVKAISLYDTGITPQYGDALLTLSTCNYHTANGRFVVMARKVQGEP